MKTPSLPPPAEVVGVEFKPLRAKDIVKNAVYEVKVPAHVYHARLGLPNFDLECLTCRAKAPNDNCPGHPGRISLPARVYHPLRVSALVKLLKGFCIYCYKLKGNEEDKGKVAEADTNGKEGGEGDEIVVPDSEDEEFVVPDSEDEEVVVPDSEDDEIVVPDSENDNVGLVADSEDDVGIVADTEHDNIVPDSEDEFEHQNPDVVQDSEAEGGPDNAADGTCPIPNVVPDSDDDGVLEKENPDTNGAAKSGGPEMADDNAVQNVSSVCNCSFHSEMYPDVKVKVLKKTVLGITVAVVLMTYNRKTKGSAISSDVQKQLFPVDWVYFKERRWKSKLLQPDEAFQMLKRIYREKQKNIWKPDDYFIDTLYVQSNCMRTQADPDCHLYAGISTALRVLLKKMKSMTVARDGRCLRQYTDKEALELQAYVGRCFRANMLQFGNSAADVDKPGSGGSGLLFLRKTVAKKMYGGSSRGVVRGDPYITTDEIGIPAKVARGVSVPELVTEHNMSRLQSYADADLIISVRRNKATVKWSRHMKSIKLELGDEVERVLLDGDKLFVNRPPTFHKHALISLRAKVYGDNVFSVNPFICTPMFGDFDGDAIHVSVAQSLEGAAEMSQLMTVSNQLVSSQGGNCIMGMIQDSLLGSYLLTRRDLFLRKSEMDQLYLWSLEELGLPVPAVFKSPKGPRWTGNQIFGMTLPKGLDYQHGGMCISNSEVVTVEGKSSSWLGRLRGSIMRSICDSHGPEAALHHLNSIQRVANEWISQRGFSVGLMDFYITPDAIGRRKLEEEMLSAVDEAKAFALVQAVLVDADVQINSVVNSRRHVWEGDGDCTNVDSRKAAELEQASIRGFETVMKDFERVIRRHASRGNALLHMIKAGSKGSLSNLVKQGACIGLQLREGRFQFDPAFSLVPCYQQKADLMSSELWKRKGLVRNSFLDGLDPHEFFAHSISSRPSSNLMKKCSAMFRMIMCYLKDLRVEYDGTVRSTYGGSVYQFESEAEPGEAVGALAATAIIEPIYDKVMNSSGSVSATDEHPFNTFANILEPGHSTPTQMDRKVMLRLSKDAAQGVRGPEWVALEVQNHLKPIELRMVAASISIEFDHREVIDGCAKVGPWIGCIGLQREILWRTGLDLNSIVVFLCNNVEGFHFYSRSDTLCFFFTQKKVFADEDTIHHLLVETIFPRLLDYTVKGYSNIESATIKWDFELDEIVVEVLTKPRPKRGLAWEIVTNACVPIMNLLDWKTSSPVSLQETRYVLGVEAACGRIVPKLKSLMKTFDRNTSETHMRLVADAACYSGNLLGYKASDYEEYLSSMSCSSPLAVALTQKPKLVFDVAALERKVDHLQGATEMVAFGKRPLLGTGASFELLYNEKSLDGSLCPSNVEFETFLHSSGPKSATQQTANRTYQPIQELRRKLRAILLKSVPGAAVSKQDEQMILGVLIYHEDYRSKIGCGVQYIKVDIHPNYEGTKCFFVVRTDGSQCDFSYHKCLSRMENEMSGPS